MSDIYLLIEGKQEGPYTEDQVRQSLEDGSIPSDLPAWDGIGPDWVPVETLLRVADAGVSESQELTESTGTEVSAREPEHTLSEPMIQEPASGTPKKAKAIRYIALGSAIAVAFALVWIVVATTLFHQTSGSKSAVASSQVITEASNATAESAGGSPTAPTQAVDGAADASTQAKRLADIEEARSFIEKELGRNSTVKVIKKQPSVRIETETGHIYITYIGFEEVDCLLGSLDADSVAQKTGSWPTIVIPTKDRQQTIRFKKGNSFENNYRIELVFVPEEDRVATAFRFLINAYSTSGDGSDLDAGDIRTKLCKELKDAMLSDNTLRDCEVSYDKSTETLHLRLTNISGPYAEVLLPMRKVDPQGMKWQPSGRNRSLLSFPTINDESAIRFYNKWSGHESESTKTYLTLSFATEDDASQCADTVQQLCAELGWKPSKF